MYLLLIPNTWRSGPDYDANVTAGLFDFNDKKNMWNVGGKAAVSTLWVMNQMAIQKQGIVNNYILEKSVVDSTFNVSAGTY